MREECLVSVVITTYNRTERLKAAVCSVVAQTYSNIEILVIDDNTNIQVSAEVKDIIAEINDSRIILVKNEVNVGGAKSRNVGIMQSHGAYVAFLDDDDEYFPEKIEKQLELFKNSEDKKLALVYCYCEEIDDRGNTTFVYRNDFTGNCVFEGMQDCIAATSQWMCRKDYLLDVDCFSDVPCKQDSTLIVKLLCAGYSIDRVPAVLSKYINHGDERISNKLSEKRIIGEEKLLELCRNNFHLLTDKQQEEVVYSSYFRLIPHYCNVGNRKMSKKIIKFMIKKHPLKKRTLIALKDYLRIRNV